MRSRWLLGFCLPGLFGCAIAFQSGAEAPKPAPTNFGDEDTSKAYEEEKEETVSTLSTPTFGVSLVVGAPLLDAGSLPKPPFPVVMLPSGS